MSIVQFLRILWAYRLLTLVTTVATLIGAVVAVLIVPPSYEAHTRVMLNTLKPDPVTGEVLGGKSAGVYIATQMQLIKDLKVAGQAVDTLGWVTNQQHLSNFNAGGGNADRDLRRFLAQRIIDGTRVSSISGTGILEIAFRARTPDEASAMANALRDAYIDSTLAGRRQEAGRNAAWYTQQAENERVLLEKADKAKTDYERDNGIVMQDDKTDMETARLRSLAGQSPLQAVPAPMAAAAPAQSASAAQLVQLDAQIASASRTLGDNHPAMIEMRAKRATLVQMAAQEQAAARAAAVAAAGSGRVDLNRAVAEQTSKVLANRDKIERLTQLQNEVNLHRKQMETSLARASELRQEGAVADPGITTLSEAITPKAPSFPNKPLILGGGFGLGAAVGLFLSLLIELLSRKVRGIEDLQHSVDVPVLAVVTPYGERRPRGGSLAAILHRLRPRGRRAAPA